MKLKQIAETTVQALERGTYTNANGVEVEIAPLVARCVAETRYYDPEALSILREQVLAQPSPAYDTVFEVINETTLQGCERLVKSQQVERVAALNFASAKHPGGGFLGGAKAQEESLARSSGLYKSLLKYPQFYAYHRAQKSTLYSDQMIFSPYCPVLRRDNGDWLDQPYVVDFITSPAPNAGAIRKNEPYDLFRIPTVLQERSRKLLALAAHHGFKVLILGAWGCGAFRNDPDLVASIFWQHLGPGGAYEGRFEKVLFSVLDTYPELHIYNAFAKRFAATQ